MVENELKMRSVVTMYNKKTYQVTDIDWDNNPDFVFSKKDKTDKEKMIETTLADYYKSQYSITIQDMN